MTRKRNGNGKESVSANDDSQRVTVARLEEDAQEAYWALLNSECQRTEQYWKLGDSLTEIRRQYAFRHGQWQRYLATIEIDYQRAKRACRLRKRYETADDCKDKSLEEALGYKASPKVKAAKRSQARKTSAVSDDGATEQNPPTDEEQEALNIFLQACGNLGRARWVFEVITGGSDHA